MARAPQIVSIDVPFDEFSSFLRGTASAPPKIRESFHSDSANYFTERGTDLKNHLRVIEHGTLKLPTGTEAISEITRLAASLLNHYDKIISLGGDHSITYPLVKAVASKYRPLSILHIDAHPDLYNEFEGNKYSHACPFARIMEELPIARLVQIGIRTATTHQREQAKRFGVEVIEMKNFDVKQTFSFGEPVYISLDMDAIDPAFAPGVSHHEPGGFTSREVISLLQNLKGKVVGADIVEFNPTRDPSGITAMLASKLYRELLDVLLRSDQ